MDPVPSIGESSVPQAGEVSRVVEHLFRHEAAKLVATLTGIFGLDHLTLAEDVVQEALARALQTWPFYGIPRNPPAWIMRAARNLALDVVRREQRFREKEPEILRVMEREPSAPDPGSAVEQEIADDRLRLMFVCCHPQIPAEAQVALALKVLCGFSPAEIARAFLTTEAAIAKRLTRAKQSIREARIAFELPADPELTPRLAGVLHSLYLLFNEGYKASQGENLVREEVCQEAIRLTGLLAEHRVGDRPETHALLALMLLNAARLRTRVDAEGHLLRLQDQNRTRWDQAMIARGLFHLTKSAAGRQLARYHLEAGIAACHCVARDYTATDWRQILTLYDGLAGFDDSPVVALNRAIAVAELRGPEAGIEAVRAIPNLASLDSYYLLHAVLGELELRLDRGPAAAAHFQRSLQLAELKSEQAFLAGRIQACQSAVRA